MDMNESSVAPEKQPEQERLAGLMPSDINAQECDGENPFNACTFALLEQIHADPTAHFYQAHRDEFRAFVEEPFQRLMRLAARLLPRSITEVMETERKVFSRFVKNDFGQGGAWDFYWGAFYPKGGWRTQAPQLSLWLNHKRLEIGFYIGNYGTRSRERFQHNCQKYAEQLVQLFDPLLVEGRILLGAQDNFDIDGGSVVIKRQISWRDWLLDPASGDYDASLIFPRSQVLKMTQTHLVDEIALTYRKLFPLVLLATSDDPLPVIASYFEEEGSIETTSYSDFSLAQVSQATGFDEARLTSWVQAIERKKQAIFYGPPGTGKTFLAKQIALHLVGGGDGFIDLVQFHPSYTYQDFVQGIYSNNRPDSGPEFPLPSGRFVEFCDQASARRDVCVFMIDDIHRADLSRVLGEVGYLLEYRDETILLASGRQFRIPENVRVLGTINTADHSVDRLDHALRRRFAFLALGPDYTLLRHYHAQLPAGLDVEGLIETLQQVNAQIGDWHFQVGVSFFLQEKLTEQIESIWKTEVEPYLEAYFSDRPEKAAAFHWEKVCNRILV
jgi:5-methylcytosine-specific restriction enzyme B